MTSKWTEIYIVGGSLKILLGISMICAKIKVKFIICSPNALTFKT